MKLLSKLLEHQSIAIEKLSKIKIGALYMEQGTGKTRTALELINLRLENNKVDKVLWLCPCSVKSEIVKELNKHIGDDYSNIIFVYGIESLSSSIRLNSLLLRLVSQYKTYLVIDESNLVKNPSAMRTKNIQRLAELCQYKLILNGTPVSKNEADLFSQWYILDWRILGYKSFWSFAANHLEYDDYGRIRKTLNVDYLSKKIAPYTYQVKKSDCLSLPTKHYKEYRFYLTGKQQEHYAEVLDAFLMQVDEYDSTTIYRLFTALQHVVSGRKIVSEYKDRIKTKPFFKDYMDNPRMIELIKTLDNWIVTDKCIIWCKYTDEIKMISQYCKDRFGSDSVVEFYGAVTKKNRIEAINKFSNETQFFIANKTCAGYGLNLQFCRNAIYYSNDFDFATRMQSEDRIHRIGQEDEVYIYDIYATGTVDRQILNCLFKKESMVENFKKWIDYYKNDKSIDKSNIK